MGRFSRQTQGPYVIHSLTSPLWGEVGAQRRVRGAIFVQTQMQQPHTRIGIST